MMYNPVSTYRIQLNREFDLSSLDKILEYLRKLGVTTVYASPLTQAVAGSTHGYDVTDPGRINPEIGTEEELERIVEKLKADRMGWLQDIVPNHMALSTENAQLMDVLERGPLSPYYDHFDINWEHSAGKGKLILFLIGDARPDATKLDLQFNENGFFLRYDELSLPLSFPAYRLMLGYFREMAGSKDDPLFKLLVLPGIRMLRVRDLSTWRKYKQTVFRELTEDEECETKLQRWIRNLVSDRKVMMKLLHAQYYSLHHYSEAKRMINYRRFFTVNSLICLRMEKISVFNDYHQLILRLYNRQLINGLRIDHLDGLADPGGYVQRLRKTFGKDCYIVAEKILGQRESLPMGWPVQGTTGYDLIPLLNRLFVNRDGEQQLAEWYRKQINKNSFTQESIINRQKILAQHMKGEWDNLYAQFQAAGIFPKKGKWKEALGAWLCCMPVYRIYPQALPYSSQEKMYLNETTGTAIRYFPALAKELQVLSELINRTDPGLDGILLPLISRMMQFTGPLMAKGIEDTSFYTWNAFMGRNEVGESPGFSVEDPVAGFHTAMQERLSAWPLTLNATATHDTKRGEDARIRLLTLSAHAGSWLPMVESWFSMHQSLLRTVNRKPAPSRNDEYLIYQSIAGAFPSDGVITNEWIERLRQYILKALREAKLHTSWDEPVQEYEAACLDLITRLFTGNTVFIRQLRSFIRKLDKDARVSSLSQLLLKLTIPGVPDIYQGCELQDYSFVDPDNRRPVDYTVRDKMLDDLKMKAGSTVTEEWWSRQVRKGADKLFVCATVLKLRRTHSALFLKGRYIPLGMEIQTRISFMRQHQDQWLLVSCPINGDTHQEGREFILLPAGAPQLWTNAFTGEKVRAQKGRIPIKKITDIIPHVLLIAV